MSGTWHNVGEVRSVNPARRELRIRVERGRLPAVEGQDWIWIKAGRREPVRYRATSVRKKGDGVTAVLAVGVPRDEVRTMTGAWVVTEVAIAPTKDAYALDDLVGLVLAERGVDIGTIVDAMETPAHEVVEIERPDGSRAMVPLAAELVDVVDFDAGRIEMNDAPMVESASAASG
jgi:ribosomal 30S subunit maturation factor RimM